MRADLGMLINPPLGRYLLGKCLTFIHTSAVNREALTSFFHPSKAEGRLLWLKPAVLGCFSGQVGACAHGVEKTLEMMELQAGGEPGGS